MKKIASIITSVLLFALLISTLAVNVFAGTKHQLFSLSVSPGYYTHILPAREKDYYTDMMILVETGNNTHYYVRTVACSTAGTQQTAIPSIINCTYYNSRIIDHYTVLKGTMYGVPNQVKYTYNYASFGIASPGNPGTVTGRWAEDTSQSHTYATPIY